MGMSAAPLPPPEEFVMMEVLRCGLDESIQMVDVAGVIRSYARVANPASGRLGGAHELFLRPQTRTRGTGKCGEGQILHPDVRGISIGITARVVTLR